MNFLLSLLGALILPGRLFKLIFSILIINIQNQISFGSVLYTLWLKAYSVHHYITLFPLVYHLAPTQFTKVTFS